MPTTQMRRWTQATDPQTTDPPTTAPIGTTARRPGPTTRRPRRRVDGVLLLDKPVGLSSNAALQRARRTLQAARGGHGGTLDPLAGGLLPLLFGEATKFAADLLEADKDYLAQVQLGVRTSSGDAEGEVIATRPVDVDAQALEAALCRLRGDIVQVPPMHSALKHQGRPLYELARAGLVIERAPRPVRIDRLDCVSRDGDRLELAVSCSKGTYVRALADDLGEMLGCGAHLAGLRRTRVGRVTLARAVALDAFEALDAAAAAAALLPADALLAGLPRVTLDAAASARLRHGQPVPLPAGATNDSCTGARVRVYADDGTLLGVARCDDGGLLVPQRLVATRTDRDEPPEPDSP